MEKIKVMIAAIAITIAVAIATIFVIAMAPDETEITPEKSMFSEAIEVAIGDEVPLPLAENWTVYVETLWINKDYYENWDYGNLTNALDIVPCEKIDYHDERVFLYLSTDQRPNSTNYTVTLGKPINLPVGGAGIFYDFSSEREYIIFFEDTGRWSEESFLHVRLRVKQL